MADVSVAAAVISASAAIVGAAVAAVSLVYQNSRQAERDRQQRNEERQQRHEEEARTACMDLLRAAVDLRSQVENNQGYQGKDMRPRLSAVREHASAAGLHAVLVGMIEPEVFADLAGKLAKAARNLALAAAENTNLEMNMSIEIPGLGELDECIDAFSERAIAYAQGAAINGLCQRVAARPPGASATAAGR